jgi:drug/metabolite transporter (DMT)-like permease
VLLLVVSAATAVVGTFLPLYWEGSVFGAREDVRIGFTTTSWRVTTDSKQVDIDLMLGSSPQFGVPIVLAAVLLVVAATLVFLPEHQRLAARYTAVGGAGLLVGAVSVTAMVVMAAVSHEDESTLSSYTEEVRAGTWVLVAAAVVAVVGVVLIHGRRAEPRPEGAVVHRVDGDDDMDTPPFGIPVAELPVVEIAPIPETVVVEEK